MTKPFLNRIGQYWRIVVIIILIVFVVLISLGFYLGPDKTMRPPPGQDPREQTP